MADDLKEVGTQDDQRINIDQEHELRYWSGKFGVSTERLIKAVLAVGNSVKAVRAHLGK
jgi:hypothetical protein